MGSRRLAVALVAAAGLALAVLVRAELIAWRPLSLFELLSLVVAAVGTAVLVPTLVSLASQTRAMRDQSEFLAIQIFADNLLQLDRIFVDRPELRPYFSQGADPTDLAPLERERALAIAELKLNVFESLTGVGGDYAIRQMGVTHALVVRGFANSPILCDLLEDEREQFGPSLVGLMREGRARRNRGRRPG